MLKYRPENQEIMDFEFRASKIMESGFIIPKMKQKNISKPSINNLNTCPQ